MEDEERQKKLEAGKAKLAEYRQRKAHADGQKKQKKKKKKKEADESFAKESEKDEGGGGLEPSGGEDVGGGETREPRQTEFTFARTLRRGETVKHDQTYTIEPESEMSTTAEDYSTEVNGCREMTNESMESPQNILWEEDLRQTVAPSDQDLLGRPQDRLQDMEDELATKTQALEELSRELEDIRAAFGAEGVQQLQDFEAALKQRDGIITQLTANLQLARKEKDEVMREFLELTEQSQKLKVQFQQLQAGETLRNSSHSSTAADLLQARQQLALFQQQLEEKDAEVKGHQERSEEQQLQISHLQQRLNHIETVGTQAEESLALKLQEKELLVANQERAMSEHEHSLMRLREELSASDQQRTNLTQQLAAKTQELETTRSDFERNQAELECTKVDLERTKMEFERTKAEFEDNRLVLEKLRKEFESSRVEFDSSSSEFESLKMALENSREKLASNKEELENNRAELDANEAELEGLRAELESLRAEYEGRRVELENTRSELDNSKVELENSRAELSSSRQKERLSSAEIQQLMGTVEDLQRRCHRGSLSETEALQRAEEDAARQLERLRAELDEMYGEQIVQMKQELRAQHAGEVERLTQQHAGEVERLRSQSAQSCGEVNQLSARVVELQQKLQESQVLRERARQELSQVAEEKLSLQSQVEDLRKDLCSAHEKVKASSLSVGELHDSGKGEAARLRDVISELEAQLSEAREAAVELEAKHESEVTNYKIKLEMLEREKDAVLDRMAESQEAELERLRTALLFSHEEELVRLRGDLQRESQLNVENLRDELELRHAEALDQLCATHEAQLRQAEHEKADLAEERDALLGEMEALKEELTRALESSRGEEMVEQLRELQMEMEELREREGERADAEMEREEAREECEVLLRDIAAMKNELQLLNEDREMTQQKMDALAVENERMRQRVDELQEETERQRNTFSFAERNFEVNYQELKDECRCLASEKEQLEERVRHDTLEYEAKLSSLRSQIQQRKRSEPADRDQVSASPMSGDDPDGGLVEKDTTELMEKLQTSEKERKCLALQLSEAAVCLEEREAELRKKEGEIEQLEAELRLTQEVMGEVNTRIRELESERAIAAPKVQTTPLHAQPPPPPPAPSQPPQQPPALSQGLRSGEDHPARLASLEREVDALRSQLQAAESKRRTADNQRAALQREKDGLAEQLRRQARAQAPVEGPPPSSSSSSSTTSTSSSPHLSLSSALPATVSQPSKQSKRRQRQRQQKLGKRGSTEPPEESERERKEQVGEEEKTEAGRKEASAPGERRRRGMLHKHRLADSERQGSGDTKQEEGSASETSTVVDSDSETSAAPQQETERAQSEAADHAECLLQLEAQRISLSQIHAAQLELQRENLQEQTQQRLRSLEQELQQLQQTQRADQEETRSTKYQNVIKAISEECKQVIQSFATLLGEELVLSLPSEQDEVDEWRRAAAPAAKPAHPGSLLQEAKDLCNSLYQLRDRITQEYSRLQDLQASLKADGDKVVSLQQAYEELRRTSEEEIFDLRTQIHASSLTQPADDHDGLHERRPAVAAQADASELLRAQFQERQAQLEQRHLQEVERLRGYYQQQAKETQERYATEILLLQQRLQELTGTDAQLSIPSITEHPMQTEEDGGGFKLEEDVEAEPGAPSVRLSSSSVSAAGVSQQLQTLRQALYHKYLQEVTALKEQHQAELERLQRDRRGEEEEEEEEAGEEEGHATVNGEQRASRRRGEQLTHSLERVEEEIAKVIVQMSVEFAQQTELARLAKQARETSSAMQTQPPEEEEEEEEEVVDGPGLPAQELQEAQRRHREEVRRLEAALREQREELHALREQMRAGAGRADATRGPAPAQTPTPATAAAAAVSEEETRAWGPMAQAHVERHTKADAGSEALLEELQRELGQQEQEHRRALEELRASHAHQLEEQRDQQLQLSAQLQSLHAQLAQREAEMTEAGRGQTVRGEMQSLQQQDHAVQSTSTQTEQLGGEEEDEERARKRKEETGGGASSGALSPDPQETSSDVITTERNLLRKANERLRQVLSDVLKTTAAAEETIGRHVEGLLEASSRGQHPPHRPTWQKGPTEAFKPYSGHASGPGGDGSSESCHGSETGADDASVWSGETEVDEGLEMSQQLLEGSLSGGALENEEYLTTISTRLQAAVEKLLFAITETTNQLEHARVTQTELMRESFRHSEEVQELLRRQEELQERLSEEARAREQLALELHRAEGLIDGYTGERAGLEAQVRQKEELRQQLEQELQVTASRLQELESERQHVQQERELLSRQQGAMRDEAGPRELRLVEAAVLAAPEADLLEETEKLLKEKVEVQRQAEKDSSVLQKHLKLLEAELEEQVNRAIEQEQAHSTEATDLRQQIQALEKQLEKNRKFLDEQAMDREHERDVFQQEILKLEQQLKNPPKALAASEQRDREVERLSTQLQEKSDWCSELLLRSEQLQREASERDEELERLGERVRQLEQALLTSTETLQQVEETRQHAPMTEADHGTLEAQLQTEREALDRKEKEISNLEEQLEQFREELENKSEEVQQLNMQLEIQRKELSSQQQELETKADLLQVMEQKDREIALLNEQLAKLQHMEATPDNKVMEQRSEQVRELESQVEILRCEQERLKRSSEEEVDQLHAVIDKLQQEITNIEHKQPHSLHAEEEEEEEEELHKEELDEMKQRMDEVTQELDTLKADHQELQERYDNLREEEASVEKTAANLQEALREKAAALVVAQAQVQALEQSASSRVEVLSRRVEELEACVGEKDLELDVCRAKVERAQADAAGLHRRVAELEDKLREKVAAMLVSQAQLGALQAQTKELQLGTSVEMEDLGGLTSLGSMLELGAPGFGSVPRATGRAPAPSGKVGFLTEKLRELEVGLCGMQKDQELQKQLLSSSEEEVMEYERRLAVLMDLLNQMKTKPAQQRTSLSSEASGGEASVSELLQELQEAQEKVRAAEEELSSFREHSHKLQQELQIKDLTIAQLQEDLKEASEEDHSVVLELRQELEGVHEEASSTKEELSLYKERSDKLQEELLAREMTIAQLKDKLHRASGVDGEGSVSELLQELQDVREEVSSTKEELNSYRERSDKLQQELQLRDVSIGQLREELQRLQSALAQAGEQQQAAKQLQPQPQPQPQPPPSQPKKKGGKPEHHGGKNKGGGGGGGGGGGKDKPSLSRKNSGALQSEKSTSSSSSTNGNGRSQGAVAASIDVATQTDPVATAGLAPATAVVASVPQASEEVAEVIGEYQEKIGQMQELHAAEIMDMEARHISESEGLRRDVQALEDQCKALKAIIDKLRRSEATLPRQEQGPGSQFRDGYTSDSSSDWSQRTGLDLQQELRSTPEGARRDNETDVLPDRIKSLLREVHQEGMQVLSLSELPFGMGMEGAELPPQGWTKEREALVATVESLKTLIARVTQTEGAGDWRGELLGAVQQVFQRERDVLKSALYSQLEMLDTSDAVVLLNQLEHRLIEQDAQHREAMGALYTADRNSLLTEVRQLRAQMEHLQLDAGVRDIMSPSPQQQQQQRQQQQQQDVPITGMAAGSGELEPERGGSQGGARGGQDPQASRAERQLLDEIQGELAQTKLELETTLKAQHKHLKELDTLRAELTQKAAEVDSLSDRLAQEQKGARELQWALEKEKCKSEKKEEGEREELEDLRLALVEQQALVSELGSSLEEERQASVRLKAQAEEQQRQQEAQLAQHHSRATELQVQLESQQARAQELQGALERERELSTQLRQRSATSPPRSGTHTPHGTSPAAVSEAEEGCSQVEEAVGTMEVLLQSLQTELEQKQARVVQLLGELEAQKLEAVQQGRRWDEERGALAARAAQEQQALAEARGQLERLQQRLEDTRARLEEEKERAQRLERERDRLQERVAELSQSAARREVTSPPTNQMALWRGEGEGGDRTRDWVLQQKSADGLTAHSSTPSLLEHAAGVAVATDANSNSNMDRVVQRLQVIASKIKGMTSDAADRLTGGDVDREGLAWLQSNVDDVLSLLHQNTASQTTAPAPESAALLAGSGTSVLTERLLRQNAELTGFVSRLTEEKNDLRNQLLRLEDELRRLRQRGLGSDSSSRKGSERQELAVLGVEREAWGQERARLEKSLRQAEAELTRLRGEMRSDALRDMSGPDADNSALKRMYGKYLRAESFRKALIYQKKYLLLLLGGFQECEEATLALIARMGGHPSPACLETITQRRRGFTRFRSAVRVSIALSRMRFLVKRWQKAMGTGSSTSPCINRNGLSQITGVEGRHESPFLHPGSVEVYGDRRGSSRGRTGRDSPRSALSAQHRYHVMAGEPGGGTPCSHLLNYDPDRALTDYIARLEALQRRLGSVQSGSSSYAQLHYGIRR